MCILVSYETYSDQHSPRQQLQLLNVCECASARACMGACVREYICVCSGTSVVYLSYSIFFDKLLHINVFFLGIHWTSYSQGTTVAVRPLRISVIQLNRKLMMEVRTVSDVISTWYNWTGNSWWKWKRRVTSLARDKTEQETHDGSENG